MQTSRTPARILGLYDEPFWRFMKEEGRMRLQCCAQCGAFRYPPGPVCPECLSPDCEWKPVSGEGELQSWIVFHRPYLPEYPAPYNVVAVRLAEGPMMISNLTAEPARRNLIGAPVRLALIEMEDGVTLPRFELAG